jgi:hypothetical protein
MHDRARTIAAPRQPADSPFGLSQRLPARLGPSCCDPRRPQDRPSTSVPSIAISNACAIRSASVQPFGLRARSRSARRCSSVRFAIAPGQ